jgi:RNA polymerase sigma-70 factor (ECF subfamily)
LNRATTPAEKSDADLIERLKRGDKAAIDPLYWRYAPGLLRIASHLTDSSDDAEDVVQDVFVGLERALRRYTEAGNLEPWLRRVTIRVALSKQRISRARGEVDIPLTLASSLPNEADSLPDRMNIERAIAALPNHLREVFVLRELEDYSHAEIAQMLGIRRGTSEVRFFRAIRLLRAQLKRDL